MKMMRMKSASYILGLWAFVSLTGCPPVNNDAPDFSANTCGNGTLEYWETCDGTMFSSLSDSCSAFNATVSWKTGGKPGCSESCELTQGTCVQQLCGNGKLDEGEPCDGELLAQTQEEPCSAWDKNIKKWDMNGKPGCDSSCKLTQGSCKPTTCGNGVLDPSEPCDGDLFAADFGSCKNKDSNANWKEGTKPSCTSDCQVSYDSCEKYECGDGKKQGNEACDGSDFGVDESGNAIKRSCSLLDSSAAWHDFGKPVCASDCTIAEGTCRKVQCGDKECPSNKPYCNPYSDTPICVECLNDFPKCDPNDPKHNTIIYCNSGDDDNEPKWGKRTECGSGKVCVNKASKLFEDKEDDSKTIVLLTGTCENDERQQNGGTCREDCNGNLKSDSTCQSIWEEEHHDENNVHWTENGKPTCSIACTVDFTDCELEKKNRE